jgi:hypothetical protein
MSSTPRQKYPAPEWLDYFPVKVPGAVYEEWTPKVGDIVQFHGGTDRLTTSLCCMKVSTVRPMGDGRYQIGIVGITNGAAGPWFSHEAFVRDDPAHHSRCCGT